MLGAVKNLYHKIKRERMKAQMMKRIAPYVRLSEDSCYVDGFSVNIRFPEAGHIYLETGAYSVIGCSCVFERRIVGNSYEGGGGYKNRQQVLYWFKHPDSVERNNY